MPARATAKQGEDGLCGMYAAINGACELRRDLDHADLFYEMIEYTSPVDLKRYIQEGMGIKACFGYVKAACEVTELECAKRSLKATNKNTLFHKIGAIFDTFKASGARIVLIGGWDTDDFGHWTCVRGVKAGSSGSYTEEGACLVLADSGPGATKVQYDKALVTKLREVPTGADALDVRVMCMWKNLPTREGNKLLSEACS